MTRMDELMNADTEEEIKEYYRQYNLRYPAMRILCLYPSICDKAIIALLYYNERVYTSIYIKASYREQGVYKTIYEAVGGTILTHKDCDIIGFLEHKGIDYELFGE